MIVSIHQNVYKLYKNDTQIEATLEWIVGYIHFSSKDILPSVPSFSDNEYSRIDIPEEIVKDICCKFSNDLSVETILSFVLLMAYVLGGKE